MIAILYIWAIGFLIHLVIITLAIKYNLKNGYQLTDLHQTTLLLWAIFQAIFWIYFMPKGIISGIIIGIKSYAERN